MFEWFSIENYRTHVQTRIELGPVNLLIGANNAGKSNLLAALRHFSRLAARGRPDARIFGGAGQASPGGPEEDESVGQDEGVDEQPPGGAGPRDRRSVVDIDFFPHRHRLASQTTPMAWRCSWVHRRGRVEYELELAEDERVATRVACRERLGFALYPRKALKWVTSGVETPTHLVALQGRLASSDLAPGEEELVTRFFKDLATCYCFDLQPAFLRGQVADTRRIVDADPPRIPWELGVEGVGLQRTLLRVRAKEQRTFDNFRAAMERFEPSFRGVKDHPTWEYPAWQFRLTPDAQRFDDFPPYVVSDGVLRAAAVALLTSMRNPPALILLEEVENGVNQRNLASFLAWLRQAAGPSDASDRGHNTQFVLTSHSAGVLREFSEHLRHVFHVRLHSHGYHSVIRDLESIVSALVDAGALPGEYEDSQGRRAVRVTPGDLTELWFGGSIGG